MHAPTTSPVPFAHWWEWQTSAQCRGEDSSLFFHPDNERGYARARREKKAKEFCDRCPVIVQCREHALALAEPYGTWGGQSETERNLLISRQKSCSTTI